MTEVLPAKYAIRDVLVRLGIVPKTILLEDEVIGVDAQGLGVGLLLILRVVQHLHEEEVGHLLQDGHRVSDAASPEGVPDLIDSIFDFACNHIVCFVFLCKDKH